MTAATSLPVVPADVTGPVVVVAGWRDRDRTRWLATLSTVWTDPTAIDRPVVSFAVPAGVPKLGEVLRELLFALGKSPHVTGGTKTDDGDYTIPATWLLARNTREIVVNDAAQLPGPVLRGLTEFAVGVGARLWLIGHHNRAAGLDDITADWDATCWTLEQFDAAWRRPDTTPQRRVPQPPSLTRSSLPADSALLFRAECRRLLNPDRFATVDAVYCAELKEAHTHFQQRQHESRLTHDTVAAHLRRRVRACPDPDTIVVTVRAIEAAALVAGYAVDVDLPALLNAAERNPRPGRVTLEDTAAPDAYTRPGYAAAAALAMLEVPANHIVDLTVGDVAADGTRVTTLDGVTEAPPQLRPYLAAQALTRQFAGAAPSDAYLLTETGNPVKISWVSRAVKLAEVECSLRLARPRYDRKTLTVFEWLTAHGLGVRSLNDRRTARRQRS